MLLPIYHVALKIWPMNSRPSASILFFYYGWLLLYWIWLVWNQFFLLLNDDSDDGLILILKALIIFPRMPLISADIIVFRKKPSSYLENKAESKHVKIRYGSRKKSSLVGLTCWLWWGMIHFKFPRRKSKECFKIPFYFGFSPKVEFFFNF